MPDSISRAAQSAAGSAATALEGAVWDALGRRDAVAGARSEAERSGLPGVNDGGPGDAYRHLLIAGEMKRRFGPTFAGLFAGGHEFVNEMTGSQTEADEEMDDRNNALAAAGPEHKTWEDVVAWARRKIVEAAPHGGDGADGRAFWYTKQPPGWRPDFTGVPIERIEKGGPEHRYHPNKPPNTPLINEPQGMADASGAGAATDPLDRPVATWSREDLARVMASPAYHRPGHPRRRRAHATVRAWFERRDGTAPAPAPRDATGRMVRPGGRAAAAAAAGGGGCELEVRGHAREGGEVRVRAHCRSLPG